MHHFAYVFERFPSFTQTFCAREFLELERLGVRPLVFSIHDTRKENIRHFPAELFEQVIFLPESGELVRQVRGWMSENRLPQAVVLTLRQWGERPDKQRVYEAVWIGQYLRDREIPISHAHTHFAGLGARTCWWLRKFYGQSFSFTVHANDFFCNTEGQTVSMAALFRDASLVITVSDYMVRELQRHFPKAAKRVRRVYNGLDLAPFIAARAAAPARNQGGILSVGRLIEKKGYDDLIAACAILRDRGIQFHCRIVGEGPLEDELREQIEGLQLTAQVELTGPLSMAEITRLLAEETQVFALACKTESHGGKDNLPTVLMEAMAASLPCVSTRLAGVPEMVIDGVTGRLCDEKDAPAFADLLAELLQDPAKCQTMGQAGLAHAQTHFAKETTARQLLRNLVERGSVKWDSALARSQALVGSFIRRRVRLSPQLRHKLIKARDKSFDLAQFMGGA